MAARSLLDTPPPLAIGRYELANRVAGGQIATLYRARDADTGTPVALQLIPSEGQKDPKLFDRLRAEFDQVAPLEHPNMLRLLAFGRESGYWFVASEWIEGTNLVRLLQDRTRLAEDHAVRIIAQVGQAVDFAGRANVTCRANTSNVVIRNDGLAKLVPFGPAVGCVPIPPPAAQITGPTSPLDGPLPDPANAPAADAVYCLAATLYSAVTGREWVPPAVRAAQIPDRRKRRAVAAPVRPAGLSERVDQAIRRATSDEAEERPTSCADFLTVLHGRSRTVGTAKGDSRLVTLNSDDRRAHVRYVVGVGSSGTIHDSVFDSPMDGPSSQEVWPLVIRDVSAGGIGILLARRCEPGTELLIVLPGGEKTGMRLVPVQVVRVKRENHGHWAHGCCFFEQLDEYQLGALLDQFARDGA